MVESPAGEDPIPLRREMVTAFVGPAPRGPAHIPVAVESVAEYRKRFGSPVERSRMELLLDQYFENGGRRALVVRVPSSGGRNRIVLPGSSGPLDLAAVNPGPLEYLRASVDYDGLPAGAPTRFNLTLQRIQSPGRPLVEEQEVWRDVSTVPGSERYVADLLNWSVLVRATGSVPASRPDATPGSAAIGPVGYINCQGNWRHSSPPTDYDLIGSRREGTGLHALEQVAAVDLVCLLSGSPASDVGPVALFAAERYCARRHAMLLLDPPAHWDNVADVLKSQRERGFSSPNVLTCFPRLMEAVADGHRAAAPARTLSASGAVAGLLARQERESAAPAGDERNILRSRARVAVAVDDEEATVLVRAGVNVLQQMAPGQIGLRGLVTLARNGGSRPEWRQLAVRRRVIGIVGTLARSTRWAAVRPNAPVLWQAVSAQVSRYLTECQSAGLLFPLAPTGGVPGGAAPGRAAQNAFYVKCDQDINAGRSAPAFIVGLAIGRSGDFAAFRFEHRTDDCRVTEVTWQPGLALAV